MLAKFKAIKKKRVFSKEFQLEIVRCFEQGRYSVYQLARLYGIRNCVIYRWIYKHSSFNQAGCRIVEMKQSTSSKLKALEQRIKELERLVGQKQIKIEFLEEMIKVAKEELNVDIKKKSSTPQSTASGVGRKP